jgi:alkanesulfonate monooxygenase SsuD/methylene tetrahydromethanopterin reductase-like flavin-dependent oxidoreductase (luciferase family)
LTVNFAQAYSVWPHEGASAVNVGIGLPTTTPGASGALLIEWARRADEGPFSSLAVLDRILYDSVEPLAALAAAAAVTDRIRLATMIVIGPLRNTALLAKQAASIDALAGGRLTLGLAVGARLDDYAVAGVEHRGRGERFSRQLAELRAHWEDGAIGPAPAQESGPELLVGGTAGPSFERMARYADGYAHGGGPPRAFARAAASACAAWGDLGRPGRPRLWGQAYFGLGDEATAAAGADYLRDYYAFTGPFAERIVAGNLTSPRAIRDFIRGYEEEGCDELVLLPTVSRMDQLERLAEVLA